MSEQGKLAERIARSHPDDWTIAEDGHTLVHSAIQLPFVAVVGGAMHMGITANDRSAVSLHVPPTPETTTLLDELSRRAPERSVTVPSFLCAARPLFARDVSRLTEGRLEHDVFTWHEAMDLASELGFRLPSERELEWLARDGRDLAFSLDVALHYEEGTLGKARSRFGVLDLLERQWTSERWDDENVGVHRGYLVAGIQSRDELLLALSGARFAGHETEAALRLVTDVPS